MFKTLGITSNFLGIDKEYSSFEHSKIIILPIPYERTVSYGAGTRHGPSAILEASHFVEFYDEETRREVHKELGIATLQAVNLTKKKDEDILKQISYIVRTLLKRNKFIITLGGEHTITQAPISVFAETYEDLSVLQIDAHSDLRMEYQGSKYSHACVMARVCEIIDPHRLVQIGIRAQCIEEAMFIKEKGITTLYSHEIREGRYDHHGKDWTDTALEQLTEHVYVTFDVDGFDPSIMPATGTPEPNGLFWHETLCLLRKVGQHKKVVGCDVVELAPLKGFHHPDLTAAKLVSKMINYFVH
ncbi:MAG: agmatinase [Ignavibacteriae bacterium]|nr:agmatinase [Ignavibacteriota bacterium]